MKPYSLALAIAVAAAVAAVAPAQQPTGQLLDINNHNYLVISNTKHATTGNWYLWAPSQPNNVAGGFFSPPSLGGGTTPVQAGTKTWRTVSMALDNRQEPRMYQGAQYGISTSAATATISGGNWYYPETEIRKTVPRTGGGLDPDYVSPPLISIPKASLALTTPGHWVVTQVMAAALPFTGNNYAMTVKWEGGENDDVPLTQGFWGDYNAGSLQGQPVTFGFSTPAPANAIVLASTDQTSPGFSPIEGRTTIALKADWAYRRDNSPPLPLYGTNDHRVISDLTVAAGKFGWDVDSGAANGGGFAVFLANFSTIIFPASFNLPGIGIVELNIGDAGLSALIGAGYNIQLDPMGKAAGALLPVPALGPTFAGLYVTVEAGIVDASLTRVVDTTGSTSFRM